MTQFGQALGALLTSRGVSLRNLETTTHIDHTTLSRLMKDQRPSHAQLATLCSKACGDDSERYQLVLAHLRDEIEGADLEPSRFSLRYHADAAASPDVSLPADLEAAMHILGVAAAANPTLRSLLSDLSALVAQRTSITYNFPEPREQKVAEAPRRRTKRPLA